MLQSLKRIARFIVPSLAETYYRRKARNSANGNPRSNKEIFAEIYIKNIWGGSSGEYNSGPGSAATEFVDVVRNFISAHNIRTVVDLGCGDFRIGQQIIGPSLNYTGVDVVPSLIERNQQLFANERIHFVALDVVAADLPSGDLCLLRQVLQHLSNSQIQTIIPKLARYQYVIIAEHQPSPRWLSSPNLDKATGQDTRISFDSGVFLEEYPFSIENLSILARLPIPPIISAGEQLTVYLMRPFNTSIASKSGEIQDNRSAQ